MYYNENKLCMTSLELAQHFKDKLEESNYRFLYNAIMGSLVDLDNWTEEKFALSLLENINEKDRALVEFLMLGYTKSEEILEVTLGKEGINFLLQSGIAQKVGANLISNGYVVLPVKSLFLILSLPSNFRNSKSLFGDIYIGQDSMRLLQMTKHKKFNKILDICAGSGVQGLNLSKSIGAPTYAVELNENAFIAAKLNAYINGVSDYTVIKGDLYNCLPDNCSPFDCIISNPPYVPVPKDIELAMCGDGGENGMEIAQRIIDGYDKYLSVDGYAYMVLECIGDEREPYIIEYLKKNISCGIINISIINKNSIEFQALASAKMVAADGGKRENYYYDKWMEVFEKYNAKAIYPVVIEYKK